MSVIDKNHLSKIIVEFSEDAPTNYLTPIAETEEELEQLKSNFFANNFSRNNASSADWAILNKNKPQEYVGLRFYNPPIISFGSAFDEGFNKLREPDVIGPHHYLPTDWLSGAKTVISIFIPFSDRVIQSNVVDPIVPSMEWRYARIDGQPHLLATGALVRDALLAAGYNAVMPFAEEAYWANISDTSNPEKPIYSSNWSERHVAFVTGLGTFGLMTNFISRIGTCGRLVSVVTDWEIEPDKKDYTDVLDYCSKCKACFAACPAEALSDEGKSIKKCQEFLRKMNADSIPRVGCGKCMAGVPCQSKSFGPK